MKAKRKSGRTPKLQGRSEESSRPKSLRHINARELYLLIRANSPCSRADLVRLSGLSGPTVSRIIEYLEQRELVVSVGFGESEGGRPPDQLSLNKGYVAGLEVKDSRIRVALADLQGNRVGQWESRLPAQKTPKKIVETLVAGVESVMKQHGIAKKKLHALCTSSPGITDIQTGNLIFAPFLKDWGDIPLRDLLENAFEVPVVIENEANLHALGERAYGIARGEDHFVFLEVGEGLGAGIFINGMPYRGATGQCRRNRIHAGARRSARPLLGPGRGRAGECGGWQRHGGYVARDVGEVAFEGGCECSRDPGLCRSR